MEIKVCKSHLNKVEKYAEKERNRNKLVIHHAVKSPSHAHSRSSLREMKCTELLARVPPLEVGEGYCIALTRMTHQSLLLELGPNSRDPGHGC